MTACLGLAATRTKAADGETVLLVRRRRGGVGRRLLHLCGVVEVRLQLLFEDDPFPRSRTQIERAGAHTVVVTTSLPGIGIAICSAYLADSAGRAGVTHLRTTGRRQEIRQRVLTVLPGQTIARGCLLDHAAELQALLAATGRQVRLELPESALTAAERLWGTGLGP
jgi:hypothetical protein